MGKWSLSGVLSATRGSYIGALASALYIPSAGEGSARVHGRDEFWYEEELRQSACRQYRHYRVRFSGELTFTASPGYMVFIRVKVRRMKTSAWRTCSGTSRRSVMNLPPLTMSMAPDYGRRKIRNMGMFRAIPVTTGRRWISPPFW